MKRTAGILLLSMFLAIAAALSYAAPKTNAPDNAPQQKPPPATAVPSTPVETPMVLTKGKGVIEVKFDTVAGQTRTCGQSGAFRVEVPISMKETATVDASRDSTAVTITPKDAVKAVVTKTQLDEVVIDIDGVPAGTGLSVNVTAYAEATPGGTSVYKALVKTDLYEGAVAKITVPPDMLGQPTVTVRDAQDAVSLPVYPGAEKTIEQITNLSITGGATLINAVPEPAAPPTLIADAGPSRIAPGINKPVTLDGSASKNLSGRSITYSWRQVSGAQIPIQDWDKPAAKFIPTGPGMYTFQLEVNDGLTTRTDVTTVTVPGRMNFFNPPMPMGQYKLPFKGVRMVGEGGLLVVTSEDNSFITIDRSNPAQPVGRGYFKLDVEEAFRKFGPIALSGNILFVTAAGMNEDKASVLFLIDLSRPEKPVVIGRYDTAGLIRDIRISARKAYLIVGSGQDESLDIVDVSTPSKPAKVGSYSPNRGHLFSVLVDGRYAYTQVYGAIQVLDVADPANPTPLGKYQFAESINSKHILAFMLDAGGGFLYVLPAAHVAPPDGKDEIVWVVDVSDPKAPKIRGKITGDTGMKQGAVLNGDYLYVAIQGNTKNYLDVVDVSKPDAPAFALEYGSFDPVGPIVVSGEQTYMIQGDKLIVLHTSS